MTCGISSPNLFVYQLPAVYRKGAPSTRKGNPVGFPSSVVSQNDSANTAAPRISGPGGRQVGPFLSSLSLPPCDLHNTTNYAVAGVFLAKALTYWCFTLDPSVADIFLIPVFNEEPGQSNDCTSAGCNKLALGNLLREYRNANGVSYLDARGGRDHILLTPREGAASDAKPYGDVDFAHTVFGAATRLAVEEGNEHNILSMVTTLSLWPPCHRDTVPYLTQPNLI